MGKRQFVWRPTLTRRWIKFSIFFPLCSNNKQTVSPRNFCKKIANCFVFTSLTGTHIDVFVRAVIPLKSIIFYMFFFFSRWFLRSQLLVFYFSCLTHTQRDIKTRHNNKKTKRQKNYFDIHKFMFFSVLCDVNLLMKMRMNEWSE